MPFTVSHIVAVLPFTTRPLRRWFDPTALVIGAMVPDLPLFWPGALTYSRSHDLLVGPITYDLILGLLVFGAWTLLLRRPLSDLAPGPLRRRLPEPRPSTVGLLLSAGVSIVLGAYTHVLWDTFTHAHLLGSQWFPVLDTTIGPLPVYKWLQFGGGILGLVTLGWWLIRWWRRTPERLVPMTAPALLRRLTWLGAVGYAGLAFGRALIVGNASGLSLDRIAFLAVTRVGTAAMIIVGICCLCWWIATRGPRRSDSDLRTES